MRHENLYFCVSSIVVIASEKWQSLVFTVLYAEWTLKLNANSLHETLPD